MTRRPRTRRTASVQPILTDAECRRAARVLAKADPRLAPLIRRVGPCQLPKARTRAPFASMVRALVSQQLSSKAAETIHGRVVTLLGGPACVAPDIILRVDRAALRAAGLSGPKVGYLVDLSEHVADGRLDLDRLEVEDDERVIEAITAVKGFGRWSAEMFLIFRLNRPDVFPVGDLGIVKGVQRLLGMKRRPSSQTMIRAAEAWRPYRSVAAWYLWRLLDPPPG